MILDEHQQEEQPDRAMVLGEDLQPPHVVKLDGSEDLLQPKSLERRKLYFAFQWEYKTTLCGL